MPDRPHTRQRNRIFRSDWATQVNPTATTPEVKAGMTNVSGRQITVSEGHPFRRLGKTDEDIGGDFSTVSERYSDGRADRFDPQPQYSFRTGSGNNLYSYYGPLYPIDPDGFTIKRFGSKYPPSGQSSEDYLAELGTTAIARCKPTSSPADLSVTFAELIREGIPSMIGWQSWKNRAEGLRNAGGEYLNVVFGWQPLLSEIYGTAEVLKNWDRTVAQYERDAGKKVRRRYEFPVEKETQTIGTWTGGRTSNSVAVYTPYGHLSGAFLGDSTRTRTHTREITRKRWFSGSFSYHLPADYTSRNKMRAIASQATEILGLEITPEVIWNLAPWSWAVDWFSNTGDVLSVISDMASDGLVVNYGYLMEHTIVTDTHTLSGVYDYTRGRTLPPLTVKLTTESKIRRKATPFGFGLTWEGLNPRQLAIIGALGISRWP